MLKRVQINWSSVDLLLTLLSQGFNNAVQGEIMEYVVPVDLDDGALTIAS